MHFAFVILVTLFPKFTTATKTIFQKDFIFFLAYISSFQKYTL